MRVCLCGEVILSYLIASYRICVEDAGNYDRVPPSYSNFIRSPPISLLLNCFVSHNNTTVVAP